MVEGNYSWKCTMTFCGAINEIPKQDVFDSIINQEQLVLVCGNCGFVSNRNEPSKPAESDNWLECVPWTGIERREPVGFTAGGWKSTELENGLTVDQFVLKWGVDPEINWAFREKSRGS